MLIVMSCVPKSHVTCPCPISIATDCLILEKLTCRNQNKINLMTMYTSLTVEVTKIEFSVFITANSNCKV